MGKKQIVVLSVLIFFAGIGVASLVSKLWLGETKQEQAGADQFGQWAKKKQQAQQAEVDPYIKGPVKNTILKSARDLQSCYLHLLEANPKASGNITLDWTIGVNGGAQKVQVVRSQITDASFQSCLTEKISAMSFPAPPKENYYIEHTLTFKDEKDVKAK